MLSTNLRGADVSSFVFFFSNQRIFNLAVSSWLRLERSLLWHAGFFAVAHGFPSCCVRAPEWVGFRSQGTQMLVFTHQPSCSVAFGILDHPPRIDPCPLHCKVGS